MASLNMAQRMDISESAVAAPGALAAPGAIAVPGVPPSPGASAVPDANQSRSRSSELYGLFGDLLATDLSKHKTNADKLYEYCKAFQDLCLQQQSEIAKLRAQAVANLTKSPSAGSTRRETDDSELSQKKEMKDNREGIAVVFSPSDNGLRILQRRSMKGKKLSYLDPSHNT
jgi:hypothetical protein